MSHNPLNAVSKLKFRCKSPLFSILAAKFATLEAAKDRPKGMAIW